MTPLAFVAFALLSRNAATGRCRVNGLLPDPSCTPGAVATVSLDTICHTSTRSRRQVSRELRRAAFTRIWPQPSPASGSYEVDHLIPLELGGSNELANLWPESAPGFHDKDQVEDELHRRVCSGRMTLEAAQKEIASNWTAARR